MLGEQQADRVLRGGQAHSRPTRGGERRALQGVLSQASEGRMRRIVIVSKHGFVATAAVTFALAAANARADPSDTALRGPEVGLRAGYGVPIGHVRSETKLRDAMS